MKVVGVVKSIVGTDAVIAIDEDGNQRAIFPGDTLYDNEKLLELSGVQVNVEPVTVADAQKKSEPKSDKEVASLQDALLNGKDISELEETAAGSNAGGGSASEDGVSLSSASFVQSGHESSIHADYEAINELFKSSFSSPVSSISGAMVEAESTAPVAFIHQSEQPSSGDPLKFKITMDNESSQEGSSDYIVYSLKAENVPSNFGTTGVKLAFSGQATLGEDYSTVEYSLDGISWHNVGADMIIKDVAFTSSASEVKVRVKVIDDYGLNEGNQNEGTEIENHDRTELDHHITAGKYAESLALSVSSTDGKLETASADGYIVDNDDFITVKSDIAVDVGSYDWSSRDNNPVAGSSVAEKNKVIDSGEGEDKVLLKEGELSYLTVNTGAGDDIVEIQNNPHVLMHHTTINTGAGNDIITFSHPVVNSETPAELLNQQGAFYSNIIDGGDGLDTLQVSSDMLDPNFLAGSSYKNIEIVDITNIPQYYAWDVYNNYTGKVEKMVSHFGTGTVITDYDDIREQNGISNLANLIDRFNDNTHELFLKSDVEGHELRVRGRNPWFFEKSNEQNVSEILESLGVTKTKGEDTYRLDFDYNDNHYSLTCSNTINMTFIEPIVDHL